MTAAAAIASPAQGQVVSMNAASDRIAVSTRWSNPRARPGDQRVLVIMFDARQNWHINPRFERAREIKTFTAIGTEIGFERLQPASPEQRALRPPRQAETQVSQRVQLRPLQWHKPHTLNVSYVNENIPAYTGKTMVFYRLS